MSIVSRVDWTQGLYLRPEHFQQQERFLESQRRRQARLLHTHGWGIAALEFESGTRQRLALSHVSGIMPDGLVFDSTLDECLPPDLTLASAEGTLVHLALASASDGRVAVGGTSPDHRYSARRVLVKDVSSTYDIDRPELVEEGIGVALPNFQLVAGEDELGDREYITIARVLSLDEDGVPRLDPSFVPPSLSLDACPGFGERLERLRRGVTTAIDAVEAAIRAGSSGSPADETRPVGSEPAPSSDLARLSHPALPIALALARHAEHLRQLLGPGVHPQRMHERCASLVAELAVLVPMSGFDLPSYDHPHPARWLAPLVERAVASLDALVELAPALASVLARSAPNVNGEGEVEETEPVSRKPPRGPMEVPL